MKRIIFVLLNVLLAIVLTACNSQGSNVDEKSEKQKSSDSSPKKEDKKEADGTRTAPMPLQEPIYFNDYINTPDNEYTAELKMSIEKVIRGDKAYEKLYKRNSTVSTPKKGFEWALVKVKVKMTDSETDDEPLLFSPVLNFDFFSSDGSPYPEEIGTVVPKEFKGEVYNGGSLEGYIVNQIKKDDDFLIAYKSISTTGKLFFKTQ
ncbi:hypothetical protein QRD87_01050 [Bacillus altitudinis]|uniref:DUF4352 domain-containing protein n=1 Tax=Bacillus TaxID=1386 RepID=UPI0025706B5C|nr:hypothetical protein [Bacillus altitudinis]WJE30517.1 hypothetical protein QRD87_01050 [Bacillus altitudinis]